MPTTIFLSTPPLYGLVITTIMLDSIATQRFVQKYTALHGLQCSALHQPMHFGELHCMNYSTVKSTLIQYISPMHFGLLLTIVLFAILAAHCFLHKGRKGHLCCHLHLTLFYIFDIFSILILLQSIYFHFHCTSPLKYPIVIFTKTKQNPNFFPCY